MRKISKYFPVFILTIMSAAPAMRAQSLPPRIFFTDLTSGPNTGGENNKGTILTIYGKNFGATQGTSTVTVGGGAVAAYLQWGVSASGELGTQKISVAIGSAAVTGNVVVTTSSGTSNGVPFTVRSGNIFCVSTTGNDTNTGQFPSSCWATIVQAKNTMAAGDITYVQNGVTATVQETNGGVVNVTTSGTSASPIALVAYPGASVTVGDGTVERAFYFGSSAAVRNWVFAGFSHLQGGGEAFDMNNAAGLRIVGNDISCPGASGASGCVLGDGSSSNPVNNIKLLGNYVHDIAHACGTNCKLYHAVYPGVSGFSWEIAWNTIIPDPGNTGIAGCHGIHAYNGGSSMPDEYDVHIHDNIVHDVICTGILVVGANPDGANTMGGQGSYEIYNNVVYRAGKGPDPSGQLSVYACLEAGANVARTNPLQVYNNSFYDCGARLGSDGGAVELHDANLPIRLRNNIFQVVGSEPYLSPASLSQGNCPQLSGSNNDWFGAGVPPCGSLFASDVNGDPKYVDPVTTRNFHLQNGSPAIGAGATISTLLYDLDGVSRPQGPAYSIGAYEFASGNPSVRPNPPTNLRVVSVQ